MLERIINKKAAALVALTAFLGTAAAIPALAQERPFYQGKTLTLYVGRTPGSGADL